VSEMARVVGDVGMATLRKLSGPHSFLVRVTVDRMFFSGANGRLDQRYSKMAILLFLCAEIPLGLRSNLAGRGTMLPFPVTSGYVFVD
jgi:hypothetical protein